MLKIRQTLTTKLVAWNEAIKKAIRNKDDKWAERLIVERDKWRCKNDLYFLCGIVKQDKLIDPRWKYYYEPFCDEVSLMNWQVVRLGIHKTNEELLSLDGVSDNIKEDFEYLQRLYLCFRTFWKSTIISKVHSLQLLLNFPNIHIIICHNKQENAAAIVTSVKEMFLTTDIKRWFPEYIPNTKEWGSMSKFSLANRTDQARDEDSIMAAGVDTEITGGHWQVAKKNDLVTDKSVTTDEQIRKSLNWDEKFNIGHFDDPQMPLQDYEGTRYHFSDMYSKLKGNKRIKLIQIPLLRDFEDNNSCPIPERFSVEGIKDLKERDPWVFWTQMMLEPKDPAKMRFTPEMIVYYSTIPQGCNFYLFIDPASARKKKSDFTVMLVIAIGWFKFPGEERPKLRKAIVDGLRDKLDPKQRVDEGIRLATRWNVKDIGWEAIGFQSTDCFYYKEQRRIQGLRIDPVEIKSHSVSKEDRIRGLMPEYAQHEWLWPPKGTLVLLSRFTGRSYDLTEELEYELTTHPLGEHDDLFDTQTFLNLMGEQIVTPASLQDEEENLGMTFGEYTRDLDEKKNELKEDPWLKFGKKHKYQRAYR